MEEKKAIEMSAQEAAEFAEFRERKAQELQEAKRRDDREAYAILVDETIALAMPTLQSLSEGIGETKRLIMEQFKTVLDMKADIYGVKDGQRTHTFTNSDSSMRITVGYNTIDAYRDTVNEGIALVRNYIESLATDSETQALVEAVMRLMARDQKGELKASRVLQLRKMAEKSKNEKFLEGVRIIEESYQPTMSKQFIRAEVKDVNNGWVNLPLGVTEA